MIPDKIHFSKPQTATLVVQQTQKQVISALDFTYVRYEITPKLQTVTASLPGIQRQQVKIMGAGTPTPYADSHTEDQRRAAFAAALGIDLTAVAVAPAAPAPAAPAASVVPAPAVAAPVAAPVAA